MKNEEKLIENIRAKFHGVYEEDKLKPACTPFDTLGKEICAKLPSTGNILVVGDLGSLMARLLKQHSECKYEVFGSSVNRITFLASSLEAKEARDLGLNVNIIEIDYNKHTSQIIKELEEKLMGLQFDIIEGNPPFNGKSSIHLKIVGLIEKLAKPNAIISLILPKQILVRKADRNQEYTSWMDSCTMIEWHDIDMKSDFPKVGDNLIWFTFCNDGGCKMTDISISPPIKTWSGRYVTGLDYGECRKKPHGEYTIPVINCVNKFGPPIFGKFTRESAITKISNCIGKPTLHVNSFRIMDDVRDNGADLAWLDEKGEHPFYRHYMETIVFDSLDDAREAFDWIKSVEGKKYFSDWLKCGWGISIGLKLLIKPL